MMGDPFGLVKLDLDRLSDEAEDAGNIGVCPSCEDEDEHVLCLVCGVCFKYCHDEHGHEIGPGDPYDGEGP